MTTPQPPCRGRFAPSPTGPLHFGSLVTAVGSFLDIRSRRGQWLVRMEDLDRARERPGAASRILRTLEAFGFQWHGPVIYQSRRQEAYRAALDRLVYDGRVYGCGCSRRDIARQGLPGVEGRRYPGTCRQGLPPGRPLRALRLLTDDRPVRFVDRICGPQTQRLETDIGDFVIRRADGLFAYQLAVVVDDAWQGIDQVVRGADLLLSTPRQIYLQRLLSLPTPVYGHLPLVLDEAGRKLSKQRRARPVDPRDPVTALLAAFHFLGQPAPPERPSSLDEFWDWAIRNWTLKRVRCTPGGATS